MSCRRAKDLDMAAYLVDPRAPEWDEFREHLVDCDDCSAELAQWTRIEASLREAGDAPAGNHPEPASLLAYHGARSTLPATELRQIDQHVRDCRLCADELASLDAFDFEAAAKLARRGLGARLREAGRSLWRALLSEEVSEPADERPGARGGLPVPASSLAVALQDAEERGVAAGVELAATRGPAAGQAYLIVEGENRIGRGVSCEVRIDDPEIPRVVARLIVQDGVMALSSADQRRPVRVNGSAFAAGELREGDVIEFGEHRLEVRRSADERA